MKTLSKIYNGIVFAFLYAPILVLIFFSFNEGKSRVRWEGFTFKWYAELFQNELIIESLMLTLKIAVLAAVVSTIIGTLAAVGIYSMNGRLRTLMMGVNNIPMVNPEIVTGISMMLMFVAIYRATGLLQPGFATLLIAHITFCIPYVVLQVMPKLRQMNKHMYEAALDLGCRPVPAFFKVVMPEIMPGVITGSLMAFTMSLDDFVISYFVTGSDFVTLPVKIYSEVKKPIQPKIYAMFTLLFLLIFVLMVTMNLLQIRSDRAKVSRRSVVESKGMRTFKRVCAGTCALLLLLGFVYLFIVPHTQENITLNVYNWGQYIADGSDGSMEVIAEFEKRGEDFLNSDEVDYLDYNRFVIPTGDEGFSLEEMT